MPWGGGGKNKMSNNRKMNLHWIEQGISLALQHKSLFFNIIKAINDCFKFS